MEILEKAKTKNIALVGNPNSGKSSLFNHLTGLNQKVGNYPGITVDKKTGTCRLPDNSKAQILDLPGLYSLYPRSGDDKIVIDILSNSGDPMYPDLAVLIIDASNLKRNLLLYSQVRDLGIPVIVALNMLDIARSKGLAIDIKKLSDHLGVPVIPMNARKGSGTAELRKALTQPPGSTPRTTINIESISNGLLTRTKSLSGTASDYLALHQLLQTHSIAGLSEEERRGIVALKKESKVDFRSLQTRDTIERYKYIDTVLGDVIRQELTTRRSLTDTLDAILVHKVGGYLIFFGLLFLIFQAIFYWALLPMDMIDAAFARLSLMTKTYLPAGPFTDMISEGVLPGLGGIAIFIPQIAILFGFIAILEDTGYMARVVFLMDKLMRRFGLNGKSVVPLVSGVACAIPAIMATRGIENWKERLTTILITPFMTCSARLPVYIILIGLVVPNVNYWGFVNLQGLVLMMMYLLGFVTAILVGALLKYAIRSKGRSVLMMEMPLYKVPRWKNVGMTMYEKTKTFVTQPGKIIFAISIILWVLSSYGPSGEISRAEEAVRDQAGIALSEQELENRINTYRLEHSYAASMGKLFEPVITPLGYDWKIGIALITSFAAREVFVSTIATIYSVGDDFEDESTIRKKMKAEINPETGGPRYTLAVAFSLLVFYAFAMQCMSTVAVVYRETKSWKWPAVQMVFMTGLAYISALVTYNILSLL